MATVLSAAAVSVGGCACGRGLGARAKRATVTHTLAGKPNQVGLSRTHILEQVCGVQP